MKHQAITLRQIFNQTGSSPKHLAKNSRIMGVRPSSEKDVKRFSFIVKSKEAYSWPNGHIFSLHYPGLSLKKFRNNKKITPMNHTCQIHCTDPSWVYWGSAFWSTQYNYNFPDKTEDRSPDIRDKEGKRWTCKHGIRVMNYVSKMGFEKLYQRFTKKSSLRMASRDDVWKSASEFLKRQHHLDDVYLSQIYSLEDEDFIPALEDHGVFGPVQEPGFKSDHILESLVRNDLFS